MKRILAIVGLTWRSALRYRLFWILTVLLLAAVVGLPLLLRDDGTAKGLTQILLTYTLSAVATLLGIATLWLSCGTLARDVEECQMQMVTVKPIARWQVWLGKWLGLLSLNAVLLAISGAAIFSLLQWRASRLPPDQRKIIQNEIFVSRASARERPMDLSKQIDFAVQQRIKSVQLEGAVLDAAGVSEIRRAATELVKAAYTEVPPGYVRPWGIKLSTLRDRLRDQPLVLRVKFNAANPNPDAVYGTVWIVGPTNSPWTTNEMLPPDSFQEIQVPANLLDEGGTLWVSVANPNNTSLIFPMEDGLELLYPEATFGINFVRGIAVIFCWLALLASIGLAAASYLSFPVASFASLATLLLGLSNRTISGVVQVGTITGYDPNTNKYGHSVVDLIFVPLFKGAFKIIQLVESFSPIDYLSSGRSITWGQLGLALAQIILLLGGFFCVLGIILFTRRELATAQSNN